jgi:iron complex transport system substrate-binding protein
VQNPLKRLFWFFFVLAGFLTAAVWTSAIRKGGSGEPAPAGDALRIVSLAPNLTEILFAMGVGEFVVGVSSDSDYPPEAARCKKVGSFWNPDIEGVLAARPTLVVTLGLEQQTRLAEVLEKRGCRTLRLDVDTIEQLYEGIEAVGAAIGRPQAAADLVRQIREGLEAFRGRARGCARRAVWVVQRQPLRAAGKQTYFSELLELVGAVNAVEAPFAFPPLSEEQFLSSGAEVILETADSATDLLRQRATAESFYSRFRGLPAVANGRIYVLDGDLLCRLGPRIPLAMKEIVRCLCPDGGGAE